MTDSGYDSPYTILEKRASGYQKIGFKYITSKYVLQSDDDLIFKTNTIEMMYKKILKTKKNILCANIQNKDNIKVVVIQANDNSDGLIGLYDREGKPAWGKTAGDK